MLLSSRHRGRRIPGLREDRGSPLRGNCRDCLTKTNSQESRHPRPLIWGSVSKDKALDADKLWSSHYEKVREGDFFVSFLAGSHRTRLRSALSGEPDRTGCGGESRTVPEGCGEDWRKCGGFAFFLRPIYLKFHAHCMQAHPQKISRGSCRHVKSSPRPKRLPLFGGRPLPPPATVSQPSPSLSHKMLASNPRTRLVFTT